MNTHPFHVQDSKSIWYTGYNDEDDQIEPLLFPSDSATSFIAKLPSSNNFPGEWGAATTRNDNKTLPLAADPTPFLESDVNAKGINVTLQKYGGSYSLWIDGRTSQQDTSGIHRLPSYDAYYRQINIDGEKEQGVLTPVNFSVLIEDGERPPERVLLRTYQIRRKAGALMHKEIIGEAEIKVTNANSIIGSCVVMPYPCSYTQKPYAIIRDVGASKVAQLKQAGGQGYHLIAVAMSFVLKFAIGYVTGDGAVNTLRRGLSDLGASGSGSRATWLTWISTVLSYGVPSLGLLGLTASTFTYWWVGLGMITAVHSLTAFFSTAFDMTSDSSDFTVTSILSLLPEGGVNVLRRRGLMQVLPVAVLWMGKNLLTSSPQPEMKKVRYTPMDLVESIRAIYTSDANSVSTFDYKERVLLTWMMEPSLEQEGEARKKMRGVADYAGKAILKSSNVFPRSGTCFLDGYRIDTLKQDTIEIEYELVVIDQSLCNATPDVMKIRGDPACMLNGGFLSAGLVEDDELLRKTITEAIDVMSKPENTWRVFHSVVGLPMRRVPAGVYNVLKKNYNAEVIASFRETVLSGLHKIDKDIRQNALSVLLTEAKSRNGMHVLTHRGSGENNVVRLLPQRLFPDPNHVPTPQKSDLSNIRYDTAAANDVVGLDFTSDSSTPAIAEKENKFVSDSARRAHKAASACLKEFVQLWRMGTSRPAIWQLYRKRLDNAAVFDEKMLKQLARSLRGTSLTDRIVQVETSYVPFAFTYPSDISVLSTTYDTTLGRVEEDTLGMVDRGPGPDAKAVSCAFNTAVMAFSEIVCEAYVARAQQSGSMAVMVGIESIVMSNIRDGMKLISTLFPNSNPKDCWFLQDIDPAFYALPGGRLLKCMTMHMFSMESVLPAFIRRPGVEDETPMPLSVVCRELSSASRYVRSSSEVVFAYGAPTSLFSLIKLTTDQMKKLSTSIFKTTLAAPVSSAVTDISVPRNVERAVLRIHGSVKTMYTFGAAAFTGNTNQLQLLLAVTASDPLLFRIGIDEVGRLATMATDVDPETNRSKPPDTANIDMESLFRFLKTRNAQHCIGIASFYDGEIDVLPDGMPYGDLLRAVTFDATNISRFVFPFASGFWTPPVQAMKGQTLNFDTTPVFCGLLSSAFKSVTSADGTRAFGTVCDRFAGYSYEEWNMSNKLQSPFVVEVNRDDMSAWIAMSNPITTYNEIREVDFGDLSLSKSLHDAFTASTNTIKTTFQRESPNVMLWNAERIVQAVYCLLPFAEDNKGQKHNGDQDGQKRVVFVRPPRAWKVSESERSLRENEERQQYEELRMHRLLERFVVASYMRNVWDAILQVYRGSVSEVELGNDVAAAQTGDVDAPQGDGDGAGAGAAPVPPPAGPPVDDDGAGVGIGADTGVLSSLLSLRDLYVAPGQSPAAPPPMPPSMPPEVTPVERVFPELSLGGTRFDDLVAVDGTPLHVAGPPPVPNVPGPSLDLQQDDTETDEKTDSGDGDKTDESKNEESETNKEKDDPERPSSLRDFINNTIDNMPPWKTIISIMEALGLAKKFHSYVKKVHNRNVRLVNDWQKNLRKLEQQLAATKQSNAVWERRANELANSFGVKLLSHTCCSVAIAQALIHHVVGDVVHLRIHPDDAAPPSPVLDAANERIARVVAALQACVGESLHWMTLGESVHMLEVVFSS